MNVFFSLHFECIYCNTKVNLMTITDCDGWLHSVYSSLISLINPWLVRFDKNLKHDTNEFIMLSGSYLYDKSINALLDDNLILHENDLPAFQLWKTKSKYATDWKAYSKLSELVLKDKGNKFTKKTFGNR